jgi:hypothetical protein
MTGISRRLLYWAPRVLCIACALFAGMFALDVFGEGYGFWKTLLALGMHLIPSVILAAILVIAWRREWIGAVLFTAAALLYTVWALQRPLPGAVKLTWILVIAGPVFVIAALFLVNWLKRAELHGRT